MVISLSEQIETQCDRVTLDGKTPCHATSHHQGHDSSSSIIIGRKHAGVDVDNKCVERFSQSSESGWIPVVVISGTGFRWRNEKRI